MNRINPLYIAALLVGVLAFSMFKLSSAKEELGEAKRAYSKTEVIATKLSSLKEVYSNKANIKKSLKFILNQKGVNHKFKSSSLSLSSDSLDVNALNKLMGKLLNGSYNIQGLKIKKLDNENVSFKMEIKW